ncbi:MAG: radical SAM/SPASM domain-containing protein [bacterium]
MFRKLIRSYRIPLWTEIRIELHSSCNRDCPWCSRFHDRSGIRKDSNGIKVKRKMPMERVLDIIDQASRLGFKGGIGFHGLSEPFLDPRFFQAWRYAREKGMKLHASSNGDFLRKNPGLCSELDGPGNRLVIGLYDCRTDKQLQEEMAFWKKRFKKTEVISSKPMRGKLQIWHQSEVYRLMEKDPQALREPCLRECKRLRVRYDGEVSFCCMDDRCAFDLGNAFDRGIEEIWWSDTRDYIIKTRTRPGGRQQFTLCRNCYVSQKIKDIPSLLKVGGRGEGDL